MYFLSSNAHLCCSSGYCIFLELSHDQYVSIPQSEFDLLGPWLSGWRQYDEGNTTWELSVQARSLAASLVERGILTDSQNGSKVVRPATIPRVNRTLRIAECRISMPELTARSPAFLLACASAARQLRRKTIKEIIELATNRKSNSSQFVCRFDFDEAAQLIAAFNALRWLYPRKYLCLFDSLSVLEYLSYYNIDAAWTFGVRAEPFEAHCWLQAEDTVLTDTVENVSAYTPIMSV